MKKWSILEYLVCGGEKKVKSFTFGYSMRQVSWKVNVWNWDLIAWRALYGRQEDPLEVSRAGVSGTLKPPPTIRVPDWKAVSWWKVVRKKGTCCVFGAYMFAIVMGLLWSDPLRKRYLPWIFLWTSEIRIGQCFEIRIETPLDLAVSLATWYTVG